MEKRPAIPEPIAREVRKQCYFGCVICGSPFFDYDHIEEYSIVKEHTVDNLALLCPNHHGQKTRKNLDPELVKEKRQNPFNKNKQITSGFEIEPNKQITVLLGSNQVFTTLNSEHPNHCILWIDGYYFFALHYESGYLTFSLSITDDRGKTLLFVDKGVMTVRTDNWDYTYEGGNLVIRKSKGDIILRMFLSNYKIEITKGCFSTPWGTAFAIKDNVLSTFFDFKRKGNIEKTTFGSYAEGALGLLDKVKFPEVELPWGFVYFGSKKI